MSVKLGFLEFQFFKRKKLINFISRILLTYMEKKEPYRIQIRIETPEIINIDENFQFQIFLKNIGDTHFPGGKIDINMAWSELGIVSPIKNFTFDIIYMEGGKEITIDKLSKPLSSGLTYFIVYKNSFKTVDENEFYLINIKGKRLEFDDVIHSFRVRTPLELSTDKLVESNKLLLNTSIIIETYSYTLIYITWILLFITVLVDNIKTALTNINDVNSLLIFISPFLIIIVFPIVLTLISIKLIKIIQRISK